MAPLFIHVGYPKTATTTLQVHLFPNHPEIDYLGKFVPGFHYTDPVLGRHVGAMITEGKALYDGGADARRDFEEVRAASKKKAVVLSSESFVHVTAPDVCMVADRVKSVCAPCKIIITIREQRSFLESFYRTHGRFGQYLFLVKDEFEDISFPIHIDRWLSIMARSQERNVLSLIHFDRIVGYYDALFGRDNVLVLLYDELMVAPEDFIRKLCAFLSIDSGTALDLVRGRCENPGSPSRLVLCGDKAPVYLSPVMEVTEAEPGQTTARWISTLRDEDACMANDWRVLLGKLYRDGNQRLQSVRGLPLAEFGYSC